MAHFNNLKEADDLPAGEEFLDYLSIFARFRSHPYKFAFSFRGKSNAHLNKKMTKASHAGL